MKAGRPTPPRGPAPPPRLLTPGLNKSQDSTLGQSLTPEHIRSMIRMSSTQNLYEIMHAADATLYRSTPELVVHRPKTSSISSLTARENIRLEQRLNVGNVGPSRRIERTRAARAITMIPGEEDFRKVIEKLNRLQARGGAQDKRLILEEGKTLSIVAEEEETVHAKVDVKGARTPLTVLIRRLHGRVLTYVSKTVQEPMEQMCDAKFRGDRVMVTDPGLRFKCNVVYLTFRAVESAEFLVSVQFGKQRQVTHSTRRDSKDFDYASDISFASRDRKRASSSKDFLELNMKVSASADRLRFFEKRRSMSEKRRKETLLRYHENIAQKKSQALSMLQKREIKQQECARQLVLLEQKKLAADRARGWVTLVANSQCLSEMLRKFSRRRAELCEQRLQDCQASRMQRAVRKFIWFKKPDLIATTLCLHHVSLYANSLFSFTLPKLQESIMVCMRTSFLRAKVTTQFSHFFGNVMALQRVWRAALSKKKQRFDKLNLIWSQAFGLVLEEACKRKLAKRKKKSRKNPTSVYFAISPLRKSQVLIQWYSDARQRYLSKLKEYIVARRAGAQTAPPEFAYAPDLEEMKQLIEKAATLDL